MYRLTIFTITSKMLTIFLISQFITVVLSCWGAVEEPDYPATHQVTKADKFDPVGRNLKEAWGGFKVPTSLEEKWRQWARDYFAERERVKNEGDKNYKHERGPGSGWPDSWQGLGGGFNGAPPPPWAYVPINTGLPEFCYQPSQEGYCADERAYVKRWGFNPYTAECVEFDYSGCGGNQNNFLWKEKCEENCMTTPVAGCDPDTKQFIEEY